MLPKKWTDQVWGLSVKLKAFWDDQDERGKQKSFLYPNMVWISFIKCFCGYRRTSLCLNAMCPSSSKVILLQFCKVNSSWPWVLAFTARSSPTHSPGAGITIVFSLFLTICSHKVVRLRTVGKKIYAFFNSRFGAHVQCSGLCVRIMIVFH